ncbi:amino acid/amide ABC transporter membrane protein 1 (HAAT family) [Streptomyces sp. Ag82_O1-15]|uniref:branched-chain amino acid ABC transporter permease n=1 Tax=Streptomyces sp. Ag82_O1-15 TaxID=1938855 RepID=UPI000BB15119|nr:branched-chain amino acid ABC transporter permease [Streptomyces sp. Ag82_O1-15]PBC92852.1 amino acid/amide ABC transporter membrane protein 1 (HAAT family) [Streptomyces sp. Ag82_O1-15]
MPSLLPFLVLGLALGGVFSLSGVGIVVLYRTTGVLYLAGGAVGAVGAFTACSLATTAGLSVWPAAALGVALSAAITLLYGLLLGPRLAQREPLVKAAATLGLTLGLLGTMSWIWGAQTYSLSLPTTAWGIVLGTVHVNGTQLVSLALGLLLTAVTALFLDRTALGTAMRALADDRESSALLGVPVRRVEAAAWLGSGVVFGVAGIVLSNLVGLDINGLTFLIISGLAAALVGRLESLWATLAAGLVIGIAQSLLTPVASLSSYRSMTPFLVAIAVVLVMAVRRPSQTRV